MAIDRKYGKVETLVQSLGEDEPVFIIRAKDKASISAIIAYAKCATDAGASAEFVKDVVASVGRFAEWQDANPALVKTPD